MADVSIAPHDSQDNLTIAPADLLGWANALRDARDAIERAFAREEDAFLGFHAAMFRYLEECTTLAEIDRLQRELTAMMARWAHQQDIDTSILNSLTEKARKRVLRAMPYQDYLQTDHWKTTRRAAIKAAHKRCQVCNAGDRRLEVHHRTYDRRGMEAPEDLIVLCDECHDLFHQNGKLAS